MDFKLSIFENKGLGKMFSFWSPSLYLPPFILTKCLPQFWQARSIFQWFVWLEAIMEMRPGSTIGHLQLQNLMLFSKMFFCNFFFSDFFCFYVNKHVTCHMSDIREIQSTFWPVYPKGIRCVKSKVFFMPTYHHDYGALE